ncbi:STY0301 family protein [Paraburkholderia youngii]|uniref:STY0301 family protein n=3 Tax=Burkholderiaceae TaxID=119060 RepID=UPI003D1B8246
MAIPNNLRIGALSISVAAMERLLMMAADIMLSNKALFLAVCLVATSAACASPTRIRFKCPSVLSAGGQHHVLDNASLFDGPPEEEADLIPEPGKTSDQWDLTGVDPYLVCRYHGTNSTFVIHAVGARTCEATSKPFAVHCTSR